MIQFWGDEQTVNAMKALGALPEAGATFGCPFNVGDTISFPGFKMQAFRVVSRHYSSGDQPKWLVQLEPAPHPLD